MQETWAQFSEHYYVSNLGRVKKTNGNKVVWIKSGNKRSPKCKYLSLFINKQQVFVHELVAKMFVHNEKSEFFTAVYHINGDTTDNNYTNLIWVHPLMLNGRTELGKDNFTYTNQIKIKPMFKAIVNAQGSPKVIGVFDTEDQANTAAKKFLKLL